MSKNLFSEFIGMSSISKTMCNRLVPIGQTQENIEKYRIIDEDKVRADLTKDMKEMMDDYYRAFIDKVLTDYRTDWTELFEAIEKIREQKDKQTEKDLSAIQAAMRKDIYNAFKDREEFEKLFSAKIITDVLPQYVKLNKEYGIEEKEKKEAALNLFKRFATSFVPFFKNRENIFSPEDIPTSVCHRIVNENATIFFENFKAYQRITKDAADQISQINEESKDLLGEWKLSEIYGQDYYSLLMTQKSIDHYNEVCGAVNRHMNLFCQKNQLKSGRYRMIRLHKQILGITGSSFEIPRKFENDMEVYQSVNEFIQRIANANALERMKAIGKETQGYDLARVYVSSKAYTNVSNRIYGSWSVITDCLTRYYDGVIKGSGKTHDEKVKTAVKNDQQKSIARIKELVEEYAPQEITDNELTDYFKLPVEMIGEYEPVEVKQDTGSNLIEKDDRIQELKGILDIYQNLLHWLKDFSVDETIEKDPVFYSERDELEELIKDVVPLYNRVRNYVTQKPYSTEKYKLYFNTPTIAEGWSESKEFTNNAVLFLRDDKYYLGIMNARNKPAKKEMKGREQEEKGDFKKVIYSLFPGANKMLPKVFLVSKTGQAVYHPSEYILKGYEEKKHIKSGEQFDIQFCHDLIDFFKDALNKHPEYGKFHFHFSDTSTYGDLSDFYREVEEQGYNISFSYFTEEEILHLVEQGKLFLFQIYNKDFAAGKHGKDNLHTMYLKNLFSEENLKNVVLKLNGQAELFFRRASVKNPVIHEKGSVLLNKNVTRTDADGNQYAAAIPDNVYLEIYNHLNKKTDQKLSEEAEKWMPLVSYHEAEAEIIKDKRYTTDQYSFHVSFTINYKVRNRRNVNLTALKYIAETDDVNIIGIDRGERNLLYVSLINQKGEILKQKSYNIVNHYDYKGRLQERENARQESRKNWKEIGKIKELKEGYLSQVIHEITDLVIENHAIIVMEDLNYGFKRGRFKVERQVYQKFEMMLIQKMNYLVNKDKKVDEEGGLLRGYQMTYIPNNLKELGKQDGMIFYVPAAYTSKIDPGTGFVDVFCHNELTSGAARKEFLMNFDEITYDNTKHMFKFVFDYQKFRTHQTQLARTKWTAYTNGERIMHFKEQGRWAERRINLTEELETVLQNAQIEYKDGHDLLTDIQELDERKDLKIITDIQMLFRYTVQLRNSKAGDENYDRIISPVLNGEGKFFDSFDAKERNHPLDADANGAYHIALKGLYEVRQIKKHWDAETGMDMQFLKIDHNTWFDFAQNRRYENE